MNGVVGGGPAGSISITIHLMKITRRMFLQAFGATALSGASTWVYSRHIEPQWVEFVPRSLPIRHLPPALVGKTVLQLSDIHIGNRYDWSYLPDVWADAAILKPDIVLYTGDFVSYETAEQLEQLEEALASAPQGTLGSFAILGNHDYGHGWSQLDVADAVVSRLANHGIRTLRNETATVAGLNITGLDDFWSPNYNPAEALAKLDANAANLVLCHNPDVVDEPIWAGYEGWILSGHTHGGQVKPPFLPPPVLPVRNKRYTAGHIDLGDGRQLYINRALGHLWQIRFNVRPEVTVFTLRAG
ncbi:MAG: metallophosphoesterase [Anaerolineales bacterium]|nr:metallophosphoesterase [Anaerolineales bacterium]